MGKISETWILETTIVDPKTQTLESWTRNLDHTRVLKVKEYSRFFGDNSNTMVKNHVSFESNFGWGVRDRIENWSYKKFIKNVTQSRKGMSFVMSELREKGMKGYWQHMQSQLQQKRLDQ